MVSHGQHALTFDNSTDAGWRSRQGLLLCGVLAPLAYIATDIVASLLYPGYSFRAQAVSELFAIGAPTSRLVVPMFTLASVLMIGFATGIWLSAGRRHILKLIAVLIVANALDSLVLWNVFPMHMRGQQLTFTDEMHGLLSINPFVLFTVIFGVAAFRSWFRWVSIATILVLVGGAVVSFAYLPLLAANQPTPWFGASERVAQYAHQAWHAVLAAVLLRNRVESGVR